MDLRNDSKMKVHKIPLNLQYLIQLCIILFIYTYLISLYIYKKENCQILMSSDKFIIDLYFYECIKRINCELSKNIFFFFIQQIVLLLVLFLNSLVLVNIQGTEPNVFSLCINICLFANTAELLCAIYSYSLLRSSQKILIIASNLKHAILVEDLKDNNKALPFKKDQITGLLISTVFYDFQSMEKAKEISQQTKNVRQSQGNKQIRKNIQNSSSWDRFFTFLFNIKSIGIVTVGLITSYMVPMSQIQFTIIRMFLVVEVIFRARIYSVLVIIMLAPTALIVGCIYTFFIELVDKKVKLPNSQLITEQKIQNCSQCSICFQKYTLNSNIISLPCSKMHIFHSQCIKGWTKVKSNCPLCRQDVI